MPAPLAAAVVAAIARAAVSNAAKKRLIQAAAKKVTEKEIKALIRDEMKNPAPSRAISKKPLKVVERRGTGGTNAKIDPAKELYNLYKKKPDTREVTKSMQKDRVTPSDVIAKRIAQKNERIKEGISPSRISKPPKREGMSEDLKAKQKALAMAAKKRSDKEQPIDVRNPAANPEKPPKSELAAFGQLSKAEQKNYNRIEARINEAIKAGKKAERVAAKKTSSSKRTK